MTFFSLKNKKMFMECELCKSYQRKFTRCDINKEIENGKCILLIKKMYMM